MTHTSFKKLNIDVSHSYCVLETLSIQLKFASPAPLGYLPSIRGTCNYYLVVFFIALRRVVWNQRYKQP